MLACIKSPHLTPEHRARYWERYFEETPLCSVPGCARIADEVDAYFPYLDDHNRCEQHAAADAVWAVRLV